MISILKYDFLSIFRVIKTHLPLDMLPPNLLDICKVVFVARNPMDCCVSFYHHERQVPQMGFAGTFEQYANLFRYFSCSLLISWHYLVHNL